VQLATSIYALSLGATSESRFLFGIGVLIGVIFAASYGFSLNESLGFRWQIATYLTIACVFSFHLVERYYIHVAGTRPFFEFLGEQSRR
jgi:hypothetical protein